MFRIVASSTISFGLGYMCATYGKGFTGTTRVETPMGSLSGGAVKPQSSVDVDESGTTRVETHIGSLSEGANLEFPSGILWRSSSKSMDDKLESPDGFAKPNTVQNLNISGLRHSMLGGFPPFASLVMENTPDSCKDKETEKALYNKYGIKYDDNGRAIYYGAP